jgi:hypothetical protein
MASKKKYKNNNKSKLKYSKKQINKQRAIRYLFNRLFPKQINTQKIKNYLKKRRKLKSV